MLPITKKAAFAYLHISCILFISALPSYGTSFQIHELRIDNQKRDCVARTHSTQSVNTPVINENAPIDYLKDSISPTTFTLKVRQLIIQPKAPEEIRAIVKPSSLSPAENRTNKQINNLPFLPKKLILPVKANITQLTETAANDFNDYVLRLYSYPQATILVKGYVSAKTNSPENIRLSKQRADSIKQLLVKKGIKADRITTRGMGNQDPISSNETYTGRRKNRRVEIFLINDGF